MKIISSLVFLTCLIYITGCSTSQQTQTMHNGEDSVSVSGSDIDTTSAEVPELEYPDMGVTYYVVQIGAFTSKERAESFADESREILPYEVRTSFSRNNNLYVVQLSDYYTSRDEAESVRNNLWKNEKFKDAWILTIYK